MSGVMMPCHRTPFAGYATSYGWAELLEHHVAGDVALAFWNRFRATGNLSLLEAEVANVLEGEIRIVGLRLVRFILRSGVVSVRAVKMFIFSS